MSAPGSPIAHLDPRATPSGEAQVVSPRLPSYAPMVRHLRMTGRSVQEICDELDLDKRAVYSALGWT